MLPTRNIKLENRLKQCSWYFSVAVIFIAALVLAGWEFNIDFFKHPLPHSKVMNPTAAVTFILTAISFLFLTSFPVAKTKRYIGLLLAVMVLFIGATKFFSFIAGYDFPIDNILFSRKLHEDRIVPVAAFNFMLLGIALLFVNARGNKKIILLNLIVLIILCTGLFSVLGYLYDVKVFYGWLTYLPMAIHAAVCFILLSLAIVFINPSKGIMKVYTGEHTGSITARRLIPAAILVPALLGYFRLIGYRRGFFTTEFGVAILVLSIIIVFIAVIWYSVTLLNKRDMQKIESEQALQESEEVVLKQKQELQDFIDSMSTLSAKVATDGKLLVVNKIAMQASGLPMDELLKTNFLEGQWWTFDPQVRSRVKDEFNKACSGTAINYDESIFVFGQILIINLSLTPIMKPGKNEVDYIVAEARDITAQKKAEEKIKESEEKLSMLFNSIDEGFCIIQMIFDEQKKPLDYSFLVVNPSFERQTGLRDAVGKRMREFAPDHEEHWFETYGRIALTGESIRFENRAEQLHRWYDVYAFRFGEPKNLQVAILFNDVTERKKTEETIKQLNLELEKRVEEKTKEVIQNEKRFRALIENSSEVIIVCDLEGNRIFVSEGIKRMLGYTPEEYIKLNIFNMVPPEETHSVRRMLQKIVDNPGESFTINVHIQHKNGSWRWIEAVLAGFLDIPGLNGIVINYRDVTERKEAEDKLMVSEMRFRSIIEQFPYPVVTYTPEGDYTTANAAWEIMWQYKREDVKEYNIRKDPQMIASGLFVYIEKAFAGEVATSEPYLYDPKLIGHDSRKRWMQMTLYPLKNDHGEILEVILILLDVTVNKEAEEEIKILNESLEKKVIERTEQLEIVNKELESFAYSVSHDLRAPLRIIDGYTEMVVSDYSGMIDKEGKRMLDIITANARKMGQLIDDLLNLSRLGRTELQVHSVNMDHLVRSILEELPHQEKGSAKFNIGKLFSIDCDINLVRQVWINLISNAIKYSGKREKPVIEISSYKDSNEIVYCIKDNGVGFDMKYAGQLFGVFQRLHKATEFEGMGVGLALVKRIISRHGGRVWADAEIDKGASFFFSLPENNY